MSNYFVFPKLSRDVIHKLTDYILLFREENFEAKALAFQSQSTRLADLARQAVGTSDLVSQEKVDEVKKKAVRIEGLTPQVIYFNV